MGCAIVLIRGVKKNHQPPYNTASTVRVGIVRGTGKRALELAARPLELALAEEGFEVVQVEFYRDPLGQLLDSENCTFLLPLPDVGKSAP